MPVPNPPHQIRRSVIVKDENGRYLAFKKGVNQLRNPTLERLKAIATQHRLRFGGPLVLTIAEADTHKANQLLEALK